MSSSFDYINLPLTRHSLHDRCNSSSFLGFFAWFWSSGENTSRVFRLSGCFVETGVSLAWLGSAVLSEISPPANVSSTRCGWLRSPGVLAASSSFGESGNRSAGEGVHVISSTSCGSSSCGASCFRFALTLLRVFRALPVVATPATPTERGLESSEPRAWASCSANFLTSLEEHLSNGGLDLNLLKYLALNNAIFKLPFPDSFWLSDSNC